MIAYSAMTLRRWWHSRTLLQLCSQRISTWSFERTRTAGMLSSTSSDGMHNELTTTVDAMPRVARMTAGGSARSLARAILSSNGSEA